MIQLPNRSKYAVIFSRLLCLHVWNSIIKFIRNHKIIYITLLVLISFWCKTSIQNSFAQCTIKTRNNCWRLYIVGLLTYHCFAAKNLIGKWYWLYIRIRFFKEAAKKGYGGDLSLGYWKVAQECRRLMLSELWFESSVAIFLHIYFRTPEVNLLINIVVNDLEEKKLRHLKFPFYEALLIHFVR